MGLESLKNLPVFREQNFKNYVPYRLSSQPRILYINTKSENSISSDASQELEEGNQKRSHPENKSKTRSSPKNIYETTPNKQRKMKWATHLSAFCT